MADTKEQQKIVIAPGAKDDPERNQCFRNIQVALAGSTIGASLAALIDSLAVAIVVAATDEANAERIVISTAGDLVRAVNNNWHLVKAQMAQTAAPVSDSAH